MFSAMLFAIAIVALGQFGLYYWRAVIAGIASQPISSRVLEAAQVKDSELTGEDFEKLAGLHALTPQLDAVDSGLGLVRSYYAFVRNLEALLGRLSPLVMTWSEREKVLCARYAAVQIERRLAANLAQVASVRSC
jgi:hypothetical protein